MTTPTLTNDVLGMLAACHADDSDDVRLVLADAVQDAGDDDRAELIRVQVELARWKRDTADHSLSRGGIETHANLLARQASLVASNPSWLTLACPEESLGHQSRSSSHHCPVCGSGGDLFGRGDFEWWPLGATHPRVQPYATLDRGLVVLRADASRCWGDVQWHCLSCIGTRRVKASEGDRLVCCPTCNGSGFATRTVPTSWLRAVAACPWVMRCEVGGKVPHHDYAVVSRCDSYDWHDEGQTDDPTESDVPKPVFDLLCATQPHGITYVEYPTPEAATRALSIGVITWARAVLAGQEQRQSC